MSIEIFPLGAGQDVGRSCIILKILDKNIMLDCGLHMGFSDNRKYPDFTKMTSTTDYTSFIDCVLVTHFHLDHCGALPYFSELCNYSGPIYMTTPTRAILPYMLEDFRKVILDTNPQTAASTEKPPIALYTQENIKNCLNKVQVLNLHEIVICKDIRIKAYYAGHVLGACMFLIEYKGIKVVYTGDFNSNADRHLGPAWIEKVHPDLLISESTYATTIRDSKRARERDFLKEVQDAVDAGGKVLIPVFALGRAQELCILLETYWSRTKNKTPIYFAAGLIDKANFYYRLFVNWTNEKIKSTFTTNNMFDFKYIHAFDKNLIKSPQPMVLFATPGMLHGGLSTQVFKEWCHEKKNTLIIPGYCVAGTLGNKLLTGVKSVTIDKKDYEINMKIKNMSFSAHADAKGIIQLIKHVQPKNVMLVHGEKKKMEFLSEIIKEYCQIPCLYPANFERCVITDQKDSKDVVEMKENFDFDMTEKILKKGFLFSNKLSNKKHFFKEEDFLSEVNQILMLINSDMRLEPHILLQGLCVKINSTILKQIDCNLLKENDNFPLIAKNLKKEIDEKMLENINVTIDGDYLLIDPKTQCEKDKEVAQKMMDLLKEKY